MNAISPVDDVEHLNERVVFKQAEVRAQQVGLHLLLDVEPDLEQTVLQLLLYVALTYRRVRQAVTTALRALRL